MNRQEKYEAIVEQVNLLIRMLDSDRNLECHRVIDQFYYMERKEELSFIMNQISVFEKRISDFDIFLSSRCDEVKVRLEKDMSWLKDYNEGSAINA